MQTLHDRAARAKSFEQPAVQGNAVPLICCIAGVNQILEYGKHSIMKHRASGYLDVATPAPTSKLTARFTMHLPVGRAGSGGSFRVFAHDEGRVHGSGEGAPEEEEGEETEGEEGGPGPP